MNDSYPSRQTSKTAQPLVVVGEGEEERAAKCRATPLTFHHPTRPTIYRDIDQAETRNDAINNFSDVRRQQVSHTTAQPSHPHPHQTKAKQISK
jgi:hypothetical protein